MNSVTLVTDKRLLVRLWLQLSARGYCPGSRVVRKKCVFCRVAGYLHKCLLLSGI